MTDRILKNMNIEALNEMQYAAINSIAKNDTIILSPTGSGKTLAFLIPMFFRLEKNKKGIQALIVVPSRELALQIEQVFKMMGTGFKVNCFYGGHPVRTERNNLSEIPAVLIGTPGRLAYHIRNENIEPESIHTIVLDEFDKALEFGFEEDMAFIISKLENVQRRILTSATKMQDIPDFVGLKNPSEVNFLKDINSIPKLKVKSVISEASDKLKTLFSLICRIGNHSMLIFCNHREAVDRISELLWDMGLNHGVFHGGMDQEDREKALIKFRNRSSRILITTDLASRGLDIPEIEYIIHYQLPHTEEAFLHRNGRTARMHSGGTAYVILTENERPSYLSDQVEHEILPEQDIIPENTGWTTVYIGAGRKDKVNKIDVAGLLMKKGRLEKDELGLIEIQDFSSYAAVSKGKVDSMLKLLKNEKIKNKKIKIDISR